MMTIDDHSRYDSAQSVSPLEISGTQTELINLFIQCLGKLPSSIGNTHLTLRTYKANIYKTAYIQDLNMHVIWVRDTNMSGH